LTKKSIPYGRQWLDEDDIAAVCEVLRSDWLTTGPKVAEFEGKLAQYAGVKYGIAVSSGTAALHAAMYALGIGPGDEVIVPAMTFVATANSVIFQGGTPVFVDVIPGNLLIDPRQVEEKVTSRTKAIFAVDYAGHPCDYDALSAIAKRHNLPLVADACHSLGSSYAGRPAGSLADLTVFSFHPVKHITTGEGGMVTTNDEMLAQRMRRFRNHGISSDVHQREGSGSWFYKMVDLGYNYRLTDFQCALGNSQMKKLPAWIKRRREIARCYDQAFANLPAVEPLRVAENVEHAYHLYVVRLQTDNIPGGRQAAFKALRHRGIQVNVHYIPVHLHPYYRQRFNTQPGQCPVAEAAYEQILSMPIFPSLREGDLQYILDTCNQLFPPEAK